MKFQIGNEAILSYKRLDYTVWHALGEFIDNSTQAYLNNKAILDKLYKAGSSQLEVTIVYDAKKDVLRVSDNSIGMNEEDLRDGLMVGKKPKNDKGRSRYGMGLKTAACWFGDEWTVKTKKYGETNELSVTVNVTKVAGGKSELEVKKVKNPDKDLHYTILEIKDLHRKIQGRTKGKVKDYLRSMYRVDLAENRLRLVWEDEPLTWNGLEENLLTNSKTHEKYMTEFDFKVNGKKVHGWAGVLEKGSRGKAGFSILHCDRVVMGWPSSWKPDEIYGQQSAGGRNDLINQRLVGEIHLGAFDVTHTKDNILWVNDEEEKVGERLKEEVQELMKVAQKHRKTSEGGAADERGPTQHDIDLSREELHEEFTSPELIDSISLDEVPPASVIKEEMKSVMASVEHAEPWVNATIYDLKVRVYLEKLSEADMYVTIESTRKDEVIIVVNESHPHWRELEGPQGVRNYMRHCVYDGLSEWKARKMTQKIEPETVKKLKDGYLRVKLAMEEHEGGDED